MNINDIVLLAKAGFNANQIAQMNQMQTQPQAQPQIQPQIQPQAQSNAIDALMAQVSKLTSTVQAGALYNTVMPKQETADDILASIINPPTKNKEV